MGNGVWASTDCWACVAPLSGINSVFHGGAASRLEPLGGGIGLVGLAWEHGTFSSSAMGSAEPLKRLIQSITDMHGERLDSGAVRNSELDVIVEADHLGRDPAIPKFMSPDHQLHTGLANLGLP